MTEAKEAQTEYASLEDRYREAREKKPYLGTFVDSVWFRNFPLIDAITDPLSQKRFQEILTNQKLAFLELCGRDVELNKVQAELVKEVLSKTMIGFGVKEYGAGDDFVSERHPELLLTAATYINSL